MFARLSAWTGVTIAARLPAGTTDSTLDTAADTALPWPRRHGPGR
jgi:hypothetical protein